jgi:hypothetical protein
MGPAAPGIGCCRVSFAAAGSVRTYVLGMEEEHPGELAGQMSINELLVAMGEAPVESMLHLVVPDDASSLTEDPPTLPGL